jgi:hypothetical protein
LWEIARSDVYVHSIHKNQLTPTLFITVHAIEGNFLAGGAERIYWWALGLHQTARIFTVNGSCGNTGSIQYKQEKL